MTILQSSAESDKWWYCSKVQSILAESRGNNILTSETMKERITIYGTLKSFEQISPENYLLVIKGTGWQSGIEWEVVARKFEIYEDLVVNGHYYASGVKALNGIIADEVDRWGRYCDVCGKWHTEGYYVGEYNYACSEECAVNLYHGDWNAFKADLALLDDPDTCDNAPTYWTEWD